MRSDADRMLPGHAQSFGEVTSQTNHDERPEHIPVSGFMAYAGGTPGASPKEQHAANQKHQAKNIQDELVNDVVSAFVKMQRLRNCRCQMIDLQQRRAEKKHHETREEQAMRPARQSAAAHAFLAQPLYP